MCRKIEIRSEIWDALVNQFVELEEILNVSYAHLMNLGGAAKQSETIVLCISAYSLTFSSAFSSLNSRENTFKDVNSSELEDSCASVQRLHWLWG